jgi:hypothetical protein
VEQVKNKIILAIAVVVVVSLIGSAALAASTLTKLGRHPFHKPPLTSVDDLRYMVKTKTVDIMEGFERAGLPDFFEDFSQQFPTVEIEAIKVHKGGTLRWMFYKRNGKGRVRVARDVTWAATEPFDAFRFYIDHAGNRYEVVVPWTCGNLAMGKIHPIPPPPPKPEPPKPEPNLAPDCVTSVSKDTAKCEEEIIVDASGSTDSDGSVASVLVRLEDANGNVLWEQSLEDKPFVHRFPAPCEPGQYKIRTTVTDDKGAESPPGVCAKPLTLTKKIRRGFPILDVGIFRIIDPATFVSVRIGYEYYLSKAVSIMGLVGPYIKFEGTDGASAVTIDVLLHYHLGDRFFFGVGGGYWISNEEDNKVDLIADMGVRILGEPDSTRMDLYIEARSAVDEFDNIWKAGRFGGGIRIHF